MKRLIIVFLVIFIVSCANMPADKQRRQQFVDANPDLSTERREQILAGKIAQGMTKDQVKAAWGVPCQWCYGTRRNSWGDSWEYNMFGSARPGAGTILFFDADGRLTQWSGP